MALKLKLGNTFSLQNRVTNPSGPINISGWLIKSQVRDGQTLVASLTATITNAGNGEYSLKFVGSTSTWPVKKLRCDIQYRMSDGEVVSTETFFIDVEQGVTV